jgi:hypothetical protein
MEHSNNLYMNGVNYALYIIINPNMYSTIDKYIVIGIRFSMLHHIILTTALHLSIERLERFHEIKPDLVNFFKYAMLC